MNKQLLSLTALSLTLAFTACAQQKTTTTTTTKKTVVKKTASAKVSKTAPTISYMSMERTACFGKCPSYLVEVYNTGLVRYTSRMFTEYEGVYEKNVGAAHAQVLLSQYSKSRIDTCSDTYENYIPDVPGLIYAFKYGKTTQKKIYNAHFGPDFLQKLSKQVDELSKVDDSWKKVADKPKAK